MVQKRPGKVVHAYPAVSPVTVEAPIIIDGLTQEGVQPLLDFVASIQAHSNTEIAKAEADRLKPYFRALNIYLTPVLETANLSRRMAQEKDTLRELIKPGNLMAVFNAMAERTRNTLTCDVAIMPDNIYDGPAAHLFTEAYNPTFKYGDRSFSFGFLRIFEGRDKATARSSTTIPTFTLDAKLMKAIAPHQPEELYHRFQRVVTDMNHDMLHHLHAPALPEPIVHDFSKGADWSNEILQWFYSLAGAPMRLEEWAQVSHGKFFMAEGNEALVEAVGENLERYFTELARIGKSLPPEKGHEVIDYFGTAVAQTLSRTFPLNHPLMTLCLERMKEADPLPEKELLDKAIVKYCEIVEAERPGIKTLRKVTQDYASADYFWTIRDIMKGYRQLGCDLLPDDDKDVSYEGIKLLQLARLEPRETRSHVPEPVGSDEQKVRASSGPAFLRLISAVAKTTGFRPR